MRKLIDTTKIEEYKNEFILIIDHNLIEKRIKEIAEQIHVGNIEDYLEPNNSELYNTILLRIIVEIFRNKIVLEENKPYIINFNFVNEKYRLSITKLKLDKEERIMYGLITR